MIKAFWMALTGFALATTAVAQTHPAGTYTIIDQTAPEGTLTIRRSNAGPNQITGTVFGDRLEGYYAAGSQQAVWVRFSGNVPVQVYVATYSRHPRIGRLTPYEFRGTSYAINQFVEADPRRNAFGFRAWFLVPQTNPPAPNTDPPTPNTPHPAPIPRAWLLFINQTQSPMRLEVAADGTVAGRIFGDRIVGHYASVGGTIAFLRMDRRDQPIQFYAGRVIGHSFLGSVFGLNEQHGGASQQVNELVFHAVHRSPNEPFVTYRSVLSGLCLEVENSAMTNGAFLRHKTCTGAPNQQFTTVLTDPSNPAGPIALMAKHSGKCLDIPNFSRTRGARVQQFDCNGGVNQQVIFQGVSNTGCPLGFDFCQAIKFVHSRQCITVKGSEVVQGGCTTNKQAIMFDH